ncbi:GNAT family N-acetyltransferase [Streptomyces fagopyri]|uniref:GNAT family N-acetyltransferase n=1 Tax=Streptomyces fagopyri TaxID=2662397 RepID=UPI0033CCB70E
MTSAASTIELRTFSELGPVRGDVVDVYAEVRAPLLHLLNYAVTAFGKRLDGHGAEPGFTLVLAYTDGHPVGYAYGNRIEHGDRYWQRTTPEPAQDYTQHPIVALKEIGVRDAWRGTGTARRMHDAFLATRDEPYVPCLCGQSSEIYIVICFGWYHR